MTIPAGPFLRTMFSSDDLGVAQRLALFDRFLTDSRHGTRVCSDRPDLFAARVRAVQLGSIEVSELTAAHVSVVRTSSLIRAADPETYDFVAPLAGRALLRQAGRDVVLRPGWMTLRSSGRPFELRVPRGPARARLIRAQVPRALLAHRRQQLDRLLAEPVPALGGMGSVFMQFLAGLAAGSAAQASHYRPSDLPRLGTVTLDMFDALLAHLLDPALEVLPTQQGLLARVMAHIAENLGDPDLTPARVAAAHHVSVSSLHRLFAGSELTVAATIRSQRLARARHDLADPRMAHLTINRIATRWGFRDHATFTRAFRATYGVPPRAVRPDPVGDQPEMAHPNALKAPSSTRTPATSQAFHDVVDS